MAKLFEWLRWLWSCIVNGVYGGAPGKVQTSGDALSPLEVPLPSVDPIQIASGSFAPPEKASGGRGDLTAAMRALLAGARTLGIAPLDALAVFYEESGFRPNVPNGQGAHYYGVNQMGTAELATFGYTPDAWLAAPLEEQIPVAFEFWKQKDLATHGEAHVDAGHLLAANFLPAREKPTSATDYALTEKGEAYYNWNSQLDVNGDGQITIDDLSVWLTSTEARGGDDWKSLVAALDAAGGSTGTSVGPFVGAALVTLAVGLVGGGGWWLWKEGGMKIRLPAFV